jgi:RNA polymerase sigma-70 factor (ECF subfamily)
VFDLDFPEVAETLERSEAAVRQLAARAREHVREGKPRYRASDEEATRLADAFQAALATGDTSAVGKLLAADAVLYSDGGGKRRAALNPIYGRDKIARFFAGIIAKGYMNDVAFVRRAWINGMPGYLVQGKAGEVETLAVEVADGAITAIYAVRNPDKLRHLA